MDNNTLTKKLLNLKEEIETAKENLLVTKGRKEEIMKTLKQDFDCNSIEEAQEKLEKLDSKIEKLDSKIEKIANELEQDNAW